MAGRNFKQFTSTLDVGVVKLFALVTIGSAGAPTLTSGSGFKSVALSDTNLYTLTFGTVSGATDTYPALLGFSVVQGGTNTTLAGQNVYLVDVTTTDGTITFRTRDQDDFGASVPESGRTLWIEVTLRNSSVSL